MEYKPILVGGRRCTAIVWTTAALVAVVELVRNGTLPQRELVQQELIPLQAFLQTATGKLFMTYYAALGEVCGL